MTDPNDNTLALIIARVAAARDEASRSARQADRNDREATALAHMRRAHAYQDVLDIIDDAIANRQKG